jgi:DNA-binding beta-propeller fold protein YncE
MKCRSSQQSPRGFRATAAAVLLTALAFPAFAAVEWVGTVDTSGRFALLWPNGAAVSEFGDVYVADTNHHRIVKFVRDVGTTWKRTAFGKIGSKRGQLYYPWGVAVGADPQFDRELVFVADSQNNRIVVFDDIGNFVRQFGTYGGGDGQLNAATGVAVLPGGPATLVYVADPRNARIAVFTHRGQWVKSITCISCPQAFITPVGVALRNKNPGVELFVTDHHAGRVHVMDGDGAWLRSFGTPGTEPGQLSFPDGIAVDPDGNAWVAESGFGAERISKFDAQGHFQFALNKGSELLVSPHSVALDQKSKRLYAVSTGTSHVEMFDQIPGRVLALLGTREEWLEQRAARLLVRYNGQEQTCLAWGQGTITIDTEPPAPTFEVRSKKITVSMNASAMDMKMTREQVVVVRKAWNQGKKVRVAMTFNATCQDGQRFKNRFEGEL